MQLSPTYRSILAAIPDLSWIYNFRPQLGRGRCSWIHGQTSTGQRIARFVKKSLIQKCLSRVESNRKPSDEEIREQLRISREAKRTEIEDLLNSTEGVSFSDSIQGLGDTHYFVKFTFWKDGQQDRVVLGHILAENTWKEGIKVRPLKTYLWKEFETAEDGLLYLLKSKGLDLSQSQKPEYLQASEDLFGDVYSDHYA